MLQLIFKRHGEKTNDGRGLTDLGQQQTRSVAQEMVQKNLIPSIIFTSPQQRAIDDTNITIDILQAQIPCFTHECLEENSFDEIEELFTQMDGHDVVLCVTHKPIIYGNCHLYTGSSYEAENAEAIVLPFKVEKWDDIWDDNFQQDQMQIISPSI